MQGSAGYTPRWYTRPQTVTHPSTIRARRRVTSFLRRMTLTTTPRHQPLSTLSFVFIFIVYICLVSLLHTFCVCWTHAITTVQHVTVDAASVTTSSDAAAVQMCRVRQKKSRSTLKRYTCHNSWSKKVKIWQQSALTRRSYCIKIICRVTTYNTARETLKSPRRHKFCHSYTSMALLTAKPGVL